MTKEADRRLLLQIAREAISRHVGGARMSTGPDSAALERPGGAFVTIHRAGELRGCIGHIEANEPLRRVIIRCAIAACSADPRFPPVRLEELAELDIELSLLGPLEPVAALEEIEVGRHGLVIERDRHRGLLLPQVAIEWRWDRSRFLAETCQKAGLPRDAWQQGARVWRFEAEVFGEKAGEA